MFGITTFLSLLKDVPEDVATALIMITSTISCKPIEESQRGQHTKHSVLKIHSMVASRGL